MALTVEDGTGLSDADSYVSLAEYVAYLAAFGFVATGTDEAQEQNLRRARLAIDTSYLWNGDPSSDIQAMHFPEDVDVGVPGAVKSAQCEMAYLIQQGADPLATVSGGTVKRLREKVGPLEEETEYGRPLAQPVFPSVDGLLAGFYSGKRGLGMSSTKMILRS